MPPCSSAPAWRGARRSPSPASSSTWRRTTSRRARVREFRVDSTDGYEVGQPLDVSLFEPGELVDVTGVSKGHGFTGTIARHHFKRGPKTHGSTNIRQPGSIGAGTTPGRVFKGTKMGGHMGDERVTVKKLQVVKVDAERNLLLVKGAVPGARNAVLLVQEGEVTMAKTTVLNADGAKAGIGRAGRWPVRRAGQRRRSSTRPRSGQLAGRRVGTADTLTRGRGPRRRPQAVAPEGDRPRSPGQPQLSAVGAAAAWSSDRTRAPTTRR